MIFKKISVALCKEITIKAAELSVKENRKVTDTEVIERYIKEGLKREKNKKKL